MDLNILKSSIAKTLGVSLGSEIEEAEFSQKLMDFLASAKHNLASLKQRHEELRECNDEVFKLRNEQQISEKALMAMTASDKLSHIVKGKNKKVLADHGISIDYTKERIRYPEIDTSPQTKHSTDLYCRELNS